MTEHISMRLKFEVLNPEHQLTITIYSVLTLFFFRPDPSLGEVNRVLVTEI
jgi:hypothetical protein